MIEKEKQIQIALGIYLDNMWKEYLKRRTEIIRLETEISRLVRFRGDIKIINKIQTRINKFYAGGKEKALFNKAVKEVYGKDITINWDDFDQCDLGNGIVFKK